MESTQHCFPSGAKKTPRSVQNREITFQLSTKLHNTYLANYKYQISPNYNNYVIAIQNYIAFGAVQSVRDV